MSNLRGRPRVPSVRCPAPCPAYVMGRQPAQDLQCTVKDKQGKIVFQDNIGKKVGLLCGVTFAARDPRIYKNPDAFDPHRFTTPPKTYPWLPFGSGKHACPGQWLASLELQMFVAALVQQYRIQSFPHGQLGLKGYMTLKPAEEVFVSLTRRHTAGR